jgi:hypothetical protein
VFFHLFGSSYEVTRCTLEDPILVALSKWRFGSTSFELDLYLWLWLGAELSTFSRTLSLLAVERILNGLKVPLKGTSPEELASVEAKQAWELL